MTLVAHWIVQICHLKPYLGPAPLIYSCLMIIFTFATWILFTKTEHAMHEASAPLNRQDPGKRRDLSRTAASNNANSFARSHRVIIVASAVLITLYVWGIIERHPRTDDATARANVVGIAPRVVVKSSS